MLVAKSLGQPVGISIGPSRSQRGGPGQQSSQLVHRIEKRRGNRGTVGGHSGSAIYEFAAQHTAMIADARHPLYAQLGIDSPSRPHVLHNIVAPARVESKKI